MDDNQLCNDDTFIAIVPLNSYDQSIVFSKRLHQFCSEPPPSDQSQFGSDELCTELDLVNFPFVVSSKYYEANVRLCVCSEQPSILSERFADRVEAVIFHFVDDHIDKSGDLGEKVLEKCKLWMNYTKHWEAQIQVLVMDEKVSSESMRQNLMKFCVASELELVEIDPCEDQKVELDEYSESFGLQRIRQALSSHAWSNLEMKDEQPDFGKRLRDMLLDDDPNALDGSTSNVTSSLVTSTENANVQLSTTVETLLPEPTANPEESESFEELFDKFSSMKEQADTLQGNERKMFAQSVTMAFWKAIGGDEGELSGLSDSDD